MGGPLLPGRLDARRVRVRRAGYRLFDDPGSVGVGVWVMIVISGHAASLQRGGRGLN